MQPFIHIKSAKFPIQPGEAEELVNEDTYGKAFAQYLETQLKQKGYPIPFICCEDWGWWVEVSGQPFVLGCCVYGASDAPNSHDLCVRVSRDAGRCWSWRRFWFVDTTSRVEVIFSDLKTILSNDPEIQVVGITEEFPLWK